MMLHEKMELIGPLMSRIGVLQTEVDLLPQPIVEYFIANHKDPAKLQEFIDKCEHSIQIATKLGKDVTVHITRRDGMHALMEIDMLKKQIKNIEDGDENPNSFVLSHTKTRGGNNAEDQDTGRG